MPLRIGILGAARIAPPAMIAPASKRSDVVVTALAARDPARAQAFADKYRIEHVISDYASLVRDDRIDAVYNALPASLHAEWSIAALRAGKAVLCEKPFAMTASEAESMVDVARETGLPLMEAFHYRFHPLFGRVLDIIGSGRLGTLRSIDAVFEVPIENRPGELRYDKALGGGALMDLGTYCIHWCRTVAGAEPRVTAVRVRPTGTGVDMATAGRLEFPDDLAATFSCAMDAPAFRATLTVVGTDGSIEVANPLAPQIGASLTILDADGSQTESFTRETTYSFQLQAFVEAVNEPTRPMLTGGADAVAQMAVIDSIQRFDTSEAMSGG